MPKSPYPGFTPLNNRRLELVTKKYDGRGLSETEAREMEMLGEVVGRMCDFRWPMRDMEKEFKERTGHTIDEILEKIERKRKRILKLKGKKP